MKQSNIFRRLLFMGIVGCVIAAEVVFITGSLSYTKNALATNVSSPTLEVLLNDTSITSIDLNTSCSHQGNNNWTCYIYVNVLFPQNAIGTVILADKLEYPSSTISVFYSSNTISSDKPTPSQVTISGTLCQKSQETIYFTGTDTDNSPVVSTSLSWTCSNPTSTATATHTSTPTPSATATHTSTPTPSVTATHTRTPTSTSTTTSTPGPSPSATHAPTPMPSPTPPAPPTSNGNSSGPGIPITFASLLLLVAACLLYLFTSPQIPLLRKIRSLVLPTAFLR